MNLILASGSPRRRELLQQMGLTFTVKPVDADESLTPGLPPQEQVKLLSRKKAQAAKKENSPEDVILTADTVVVLENEILGKPRDKAQAEEMLRRLSGRHHLVLTGVTVTGPRGTETCCVTTEVHFRPLSDGEIAAYIASGEPMDKAGAYGIQGKGGLFVEKLLGDYFNVVGLPICQVGRMLKDAGIPILEEAL